MCPREELFLKTNFLAQDLVKSMNFNAIIVGMNLDMNLGLDLGINFGTHLDLEIKGNNVSIQAHTHINMKDLLHSSMKRGKVMVLSMNSNMILAIKRT